MKKCALIMLLVLGTSTAAWAGSWACVTVPACLNCDENVCINVQGCVPGEGQVVDKEVCVKGGIVFVDIYVEIQDKCVGSVKVDEDVCAGDLCPGQYAVIAKIYSRQADDCCSSCWNPFGNRYSTYAMGSAWFSVVSCNPCCPPFPWPF